MPPNPPKYFGMLNMESGMNEDYYEVGENSVSRNPSETTKSQERLEDESLETENQYRQASLDMSMEKPIYVERPHSRMKRLSSLSKLMVPSIPKVLSPRSSQWMKMDDSNQMDGIDWEASADENPFEFKSNDERPKLARRLSSLFSKLNTKSKTALDDDDLL